jgi:hypothetical protein
VQQLIRMAKEAGPENRLTADLVED